MALTDKIDDLAIAIATEGKRNRTFINGNVLNLQDLHTADKSSLVAAINEIADGGAGAGDLIDDDEASNSKTYSSNKIEALLSALDIPELTDLIDDETPSSSTVYSSSQTNSAIAAAIADLFDQAPDTLDTIEEIAQAIQDNEDAITNLNRVRYDIAQSLNGTEQAQARSNIGAASASDLSALSSTVSDLSSDLGDLEADFVATFEAGLE